MSNYFSALKQCGFRQMDIDQEPPRPYTPQELPHSSSREEHRRHLDSVAQEIADAEAIEFSKAQQEAKAKDLKLKSDEEARQEALRQQQQAELQRQFEEEEEVQRIEGARSKLREKYGNSFLWSQAGEMPGGIVQDGSVSLQKSHFKAKPFSTTEVLNKRVPIQ
eukprot:PhF_6_TR4941/c0_g1_i1/m.7007